MKNKIVINIEKCKGCGLCAQTCHEGAIGMVDGKAKLIREDYCDGLGNCLPVCTAGAISFLESHLSANPEMKQWPLQIKLVPVNAPYFQKAQILIAADCAAYSYAAFHKDFMAGKITLIGCSKLDNVDYSVKLTDIFNQNSIESVTVVRMEVPCCGGIEHAVKTALKNSGKMIDPLIVTISIKGAIIKELIPSC